jgi:hypothetical protein
MIQKDVEGAPIGQREWTSAPDGNQFLWLHHLTLVCGYVD